MYYLEQGPELDILNRIHGPILPDNRPGLRVSRLAAMDFSAQIPELEQELERLKSTISRPQPLVHNHQASWTQGTAFKQAKHH